MKSRKTSLFLTGLFMMSIFSISSISTCMAASNESVMEAYNSMLQSTENADAREIHEYFAVLDINSDGTPELVAAREGSMASGGIEIYTYEGETIVTINSFAGHLLLYENSVPYFHYNYKEKEILLCSHGGTGLWDYSVYRLNENNELSTEDWGGQSTLAELDAYVNSYFPVEDNTKIYFTENTESGRKTVFGADSAAEGAADVYQVNSKYESGVNVRATHSMKSDSLGKVTYPATFTAEDYYGTWVYTTVNGLSGWIDSDFCVAFGDVNNPTENVTTTETTYYISDDNDGGISLRKNHSRRSRVVAKFPYGTTFKSTLSWANWAYTDVEGYQGWFSLDNCTLVSTNENDPVIVISGDSGQMMDQNDWKYLEGEPNISREDALEAVGKYLEEYTANKEYIYYVSEGSDQIKDNSLVTYLRYTTSAHEKCIVNLITGDAYLYGGFMDWDEPEEIHKTEPTFNVYDYLDTNAAQGRISDEEKKAKFSGNQWYRITSTYAEGIALHPIADKSSEVLCRIQYGEEFFVEEIDGHYGYTSYYDGNNTYTGWINLKYAEVVTETDWSDVSEEVPSDYIAQIGNANEYLYVDLDGDGTNEEVMLELYKTEYGTYDTTYRLYVDGDYIDGYGENFDDTLYAVSLDHQKVWLVVFEYGPSDDPRCTFYTYTDGSIEEAGSIPTDVTQINIIEDGGLECQTPCRVIQTDTIYTTWHADEYGGYIWQDYQDQYIFAYTEGWSFTLLQPVTVYAEPDYDSASFVMEPQTVKIPYTDTFEEYVYLEGENGESGWLYCYDDEIWYHALDYFDGLFLAD